MLYFSRIHLSGNLMCVLRLHQSRTRCSTQYQTTRAALECTHAQCVGLQAEGIDIAMGRNHRLPPVYKEQP